MEGLFCIHLYERKTEPFGIFSSYLGAIGQKQSNGSSSHLQYTCKPSLSTSSLLPGVTPTSQSSRWPIMRVSALEESFHPAWSSQRETYNTLIAASTSGYHDNDVWDPKHLGYFSSDVVHPFVHLKWEPNEIPCIYCCQFISWTSSFFNEHESFIPRSI